MKPTTGKYVDVVADDDGLRVVVVDDGEEVVAAVEENAVQALLAAERIAATEQITVGREPRQAGELAFLVHALDGSSLGALRGLLWASSLAHAEELVRRALGEVGYARATVTAMDSGRSLTVSVGSAESSVWAASVNELREALNGRRLTEALRELLARQKAWGRVELFELLRHGLGVDHSNASLVLYWEPDPTKPADVYSDAQIDRRLMDNVLRRLADRDLER